MNKQRKPRKLTLSRETLHNLAAHESAQAAGGTGSCGQISCPSCIEGSSCVVCSCNCQTTDPPIC